MGCGCKNNGNQTPPPPQGQNTQKPAQNKVVNENVKQSIRKTIEKYYNINKKQN